MDVAVPSLALEGAALNVESSASTHSMPEVTQGSQGQQGPQQRESEQEVSRLPKAVNLNPKRAGMGEQKRRRQFEKLCQEDAECWGPKADDEYDTALSAIQPRR